MIYVGLDDTDVIDSPGTNQLAKGLAAQLIDLGACRYILRHQLFFDTRVPYTSKNGSASLWFEPHASGPIVLDTWVDRIVPFVTRHAAAGSDPGVCIAVDVPAAVVAFGRRCQTDLIAQADARDLAQQHSIFLVGLGGTQDGVIGALAAVGLAQTKNDGRIVMLNNADDISGPVSVDTLNQLGIHVWDASSDSEIRCGCVDVGKHLRPNLQDGKMMLFAEPTQAMWRALKR